MAVEEVITKEAKNNAIDMLVTLIVGGFKDRA